MVSGPQFDNRFRGGAELYDAEPVVDYDYFGPLSVMGQIKVWAGEWIAKPLKVWSGSSWVVKPLKWWNGSIWAETGY